MTKSLVLMACVAMYLGGIGAASATPITPPELAAYIGVLGTMGNIQPQQPTIGWVFDLSAPYSVNSLGYLDAGDNGFNEDHTVGIYSCENAQCLTGVLKVQATVTTADALYNHFRWKDLGSPVELAAGRYVIAGTAGTENYQFTSGTVTFDPRVTWVEGRYNITSGLALPTSTNTNDPFSYFGPNFASPEPGTLYMVGGVALLLAGRRLRRKAVRP